MTPLGPYFDFVRTVAPELRARMRPAPAPSIAELEALIEQPLPGEYRQFLETMGGNTLGELEPLLPTSGFDVEHALNFYRTPTRPCPPGWIFLAQDYDDETPIYAWALVPCTDETPPHPLGLYRISLPTLIGARQVGALTLHYATLSEWLFHHTLPFAHPGVETLVRERSSPKGTTRAVEELLAVLLRQTQGYSVYAGGEVGDGFTLLAGQDGSWIWLGTTPHHFRTSGFQVRVAAASPEARTAIWREIEGRTCSLKSAHRRRSRFLAR